MTAEIIAAKRRKIIKRFISVGAVSAQNARTREELKLHNRLLWTRLLNSGVIVETNSKFFLDKKRFEEVQQQRRKVLIPLLLIIFTLFFALLFLLR